MFDQVTIGSLHRPTLLAALGTIILVLLTACSTSIDSVELTESSPDRQSGAGQEAGGVQPDAPTRPEKTGGPPSTPPAALADVGRALPPAKLLSELSTDEDLLVRPIGLSIERLGLDQTRVLTVGTMANGEMEVPPPAEVGWYRYGPTPGQAGSAVLAGHVASGGIDGAFRHLDRLQSGDLIIVDFDNGTRSKFAVNELIQINKTALPFSRIFARSGAPQLALVTCGGEFDYEARSYGDNIVITADLVG